MSFILKDGNITLRRLELDDATALSTLANNFNIWINLRDYFPHPYLLADAEYFIKKCRSAKPQDTFAITYKDEFVGTIGLMFKNDIYKYTAEVGYWLGEPFWGKGITTTALKLLIRHSFEDLQLKRLVAFTVEYNKASAKVLEKSGFVKEGILRKHSYKNKQFWDEYVFGLVNEDL